jgi:N4-(beta-N-acetylglucosaminyl)-L-asparaginase
MKGLTRRRFFLTTLAGAVAAGTGDILGAAPATLPLARPAAQGARPLVVSSSNGLRWLDRGMEVLKGGGDTLDAVLAVVTPVEDDPNDSSVGYGGLPNEQGVVELDASVMHGPTRRAGAVASVQRIKNPARLAKLVMERTDHVLLVGPGAQMFARAHGFAEENLLTERSRIAWLRWKESHSDRDSWGPGLDSPEWKQQTRQMLPEHLSEEEKDEWVAWIHRVLLDPPTGTINCLAVDSAGDISGTTTTSGLAWKIPGRVGDSPIVGAGLYVDNDVGAAGSTGRGEECIKVNGAHTIVEAMRRGKSPTDACLEALERVARNYNGDRARLGRFHLLFYALNKDGVHGGASLWSAAPGGQRRTYAIHDGTEARLVDCAALFDRAQP